MYASGRLHQIYLNVSRIFIFSCNRLIMSLSDLFHVHYSGGGSVLRV